MSKALELQKLSNKINLMESGVNKKQENISRDNPSQNIWDKL